ncbi:MAG: hypothetical protein LBC42_01500, partial [Puniceicoccales bacterium]|nr:hypothetical protein [Puniceicoccales bacterium]
MMNFPPIDEGLSISPTYDSPDRSRISLTVAGTVNSEDAVGAGVPLIETGNMSKVGAGVCRRIKDDPAYRNIFSLLELSLLECIRPCLEQAIVSGGALAVSDCLAANWKADHYDQDFAKILDQNGLFVLPLNKDTDTSQGSNYCIVEKVQDNLFYLYEINLSQGDGVPEERSIYGTSRIPGRIMTCTDIVSTMKAAEFLAANSRKYWIMPDPDDKVSDIPEPKEPVGLRYDAMWTPERFLGYQGYNIRSVPIDEFKDLRPTQMVVARRNGNCAVAAHDEMMRFLIMKKMSREMGVSINDPAVQDAGDILYRKFCLTEKALYNMNAAAVFCQDLPQYLINIQGNITQNPEHFKQAKQWDGYRKNILNALKGVAADFHQYRDIPGIDELERMFADQIAACMRRLKEPAYRQLELLCLNPNSTYEEFGSTQNAALVASARDAAQRLFANAPRTSDGVAETLPPVKEEFHYDPNALRHADGITNTLAEFIRYRANPKDYAEAAVALFRDLPNVEDDIWKTLSREHGLEIMQQFGAITAKFKESGIPVSPYENFGSAESSQLNQSFFCCDTVLPNVPVAVIHVFVKM